MSNNSFRIENIWIAIVWVFIFMLILAWDQEKIVVLNLILFCYFLYFMVGKALNSNLTQRQLVLKDSLLVELNSQVNFLTALIHESLSINSSYNQLVLRVLNKFVVSARNLSNININGAAETNSLINFLALNVNLHILSDQVLLVSFQQNILAAEQILLESSSIFTIDKLEEN